VPVDNEELGSFCGLPAQHLVDDACGDDARLIVSARPTGIRVARADRRTAECCWSGLGRDVLDVGVDDPQRQLEALRSVSRPRERIARRVGTVDPDQHVPHVPSLRARRCNGRYGTARPSSRTAEERTSSGHTPVSHRSPSRHRGTR
jgi:hypothetical protein